MSTPLVSIITPIYNIEDRLIHRLLNSIYNAQLPSSLFEVLLVDDGSNPPVDLLRLPHTTEMNIHLFRQNNRGLGSARNRAIPEAMGKYLYFVDADDYLFTENLHALIHDINTQQYDVAIVRWEKVESESQTPHVKGSQAPLLWTSGIEYGMQRKWNGGIARYLFSRKMVIEKAIWFPEGVWHEDELFITQALFYAQNLLEIRRSIYAYYLRIDSITQKKSCEAICKRITDRLNAILQVECWIKTLPSLQNQESDVLYKKRDFLIVDFLISLCKENLPYSKFLEQYERLIELKFLPLSNQSYGLKYRLFKEIARYPQVLYQLSPIIKRAL